MSDTAYALLDEDDRTTMTSDENGLVNPAPDFDVSTPIDRHASGTATVDKPVQFPKMPAASEFIPDIAWEGVVEEVFEDYFSARLVDTKKPSDVELTEIYNSSVTDRYDLVLIKPGAIFFWTIGHRIAGHRTEHVSQIMFRRVPVWSKNESGNALRKAEKSKEILGW